MFRGFSAFIMRGNIVDFAVAFVMGAAFSAVVQALVKDLLTPLIAAIVGKPDFSALTFEVNSSTFRYGDFINALIAFVLIALAVYYFVVVPVNTMTAWQNRGKETAAPTTRPCQECLTLIPLGARRCSACTSVVVSA